MKNGVFIRVDNATDVEKQIKSLLKSQVLIGIPAEDAARDPEPGEQSVNEPITNAEIGYVMEFGLPEKNIPARAALIPGVREAKEKLGEIMKIGAVKALKGGADAASVTLNKAGLVASNAVKQKITDGPFAPLAESTLEDRARRGRKGAAKELASRAAGNAPNNANAKPLIDTGQYRNAFTYVVRPKGK